MTGARYIAHRLSRSSPRLLPTLLRPNEASSKISKRKCLQIGAATVNALVQESLRSLQGRDGQQQVNAVEESMHSLDSQGRDGQANQQVNAQESMHSLDYQGCDGQAKHLSMNELKAMKGAGILQLLANDRTGSYKSKLQQILAKGVQKKQRNALDLAGKVPFSLMMKRIGVDCEKLWVDSAQAGGLYDTADAFLPQKIAYVEIKGARLKAGTKNQYLMKDIRHIGTDWNFLVFVCRSSPPADWLDPADYDRSGFWLGVIRREDYMAALKGTKLEKKTEISVTVTPGNGTASGGKKSKSWIGNCISWTRSADVTPAWFDNVFK